MKMKFKKNISKLNHGRNDNFKVKNLLHKNMAETFF